MMYLINVPFTGSIIASVTCENDPRIPELIDFFSKGKKTKVIDDNELNLLFDNYKNSLVTGFQEITKQKFHDMMEILPPCKWGTFDNVEMFHISERIYGNIVSWYFKYNNKYYTCDNFNYTNRNDLAKKLKEL